MTAPLDLDADRLESIRARAVQGYAPTMRDTLNLLAEVERLRADSVPRHQYTRMQALADYQHEKHMKALLEIEEMRAESVPRDLLLQVGWLSPEGGLCHCPVWEPSPHPDSEELYVIREDTDE